MTLSWIDDKGAHVVPLNADYLRRDPAGYLDAVRSGEMWNVTVTDANDRDVTNKYL